MRNIGDNQLEGNKEIQTLLGLYYHMLLPTWGFAIPIKSPLEHLLIALGNGFKFCYAGVMLFMRKKRKYSGTKSNK